MSFRIIVLPAFGGEVISARWPFPIGAIRSMMRVVRPPEWRLEVELLLGIEGREVVEEDLVPDASGASKLISFDLEQREVALAFLGRPDLAGDRVARAQVEAADLRRRDVDVVRTREVVLIGCAQEAEAVRQRLEHALGEDACPPSRSGPSGWRRSDPACAYRRRSRRSSPPPASVSSVDLELLLELFRR